MKYEFHPEAEQEFVEAAARYEAEVPGLGERFGTEVLRVVELLLANPEIGAHIEGELRHFVLRRFPYSVNLRPRIGSSVCPRGRTWSSQARLLNRPGFPGGSIL